MSSKRRTLASLPTSMSRSASRSRAARNCSRSGPRESLPHLEGGTLSTVLVMTAEVRVVEVGPRDGLQNEKARISTDDKVHFVDLLSAAGFGWIEVTSFVHPNAVPQMADAEDVLRRIHKRAGTRYVALVPNPRGLSRAIQANLKDLAL